MLRGKPLVPWISRTRRCVTLSTAETGYTAMVDTVKDAIFVSHNILGFLVPSMTRKSTVVSEGDEGAISSANNPLSSARSCHIGVCHHSRREKLAAKGDV